MNMIFWLVAGGFIGWVANAIMRTDAQRRAIFNIWVGVIGGALGGWLLSLLVRGPHISEGGFNIGGLLASFVGALILLVIMNLVRRGLAQPDIALPGRKSHKRPL